MPRLDPVILCSWEDVSSQGTEQPLSRNLRERLLSLRYVDKSRGADECNLKFDNRDLSLFDDDVLAPGNRLHVQWGYAHNMSPVHVVEIKEFKGWLELNVKCNPIEELNFIGVERTRTWESVTRAEVAQEIANSLGFSSPSEIQIEVNPNAERLEGISQIGETDYAFLQRLADAEDYIFKVWSGVFHFHPPRLGDQPIMTITYFDDLRGQFTGHPTFEGGTLGRPGNVRRVGRSTRQRSRVEGNASDSEDTTRPVAGHEVMVHDPVRGRLVTIRTPGPAPSNDTEQQSQSSVNATSANSDRGATTDARRNFRSNERKAIEMTLPLIGMPNLTADTVIRLEGVGQKLSGNYLIEQVTHDVGRGYSCQAKVKRNATSRSSAGGSSRQAYVTRTRAQLASQRRIAEQGLANGDLTQEEYDEGIRRIERAERILDRVGNETEGEVNDQTARPDGQLEQVLIQDPETGRLVPAYRWQDASPPQGSSR